MGKPKLWEIRFSRDDLAPEIASIALAMNLTPLTASLLYHRGCRTPEEARRFVKVEEERLLDPFLLLDMDKAAARVARAIEEGEPTVIYGDYDADGVTATAVLYSYLKSRGANVDYFIPDRFRDGYGMNERAVRELSERGFRLIVTVDNGITAAEPIALAGELGMEVVVTDHHEPHGTLPRACAVVDPHREGDCYPFKELAGVGVAFKLICAIEALSDPAGDYLRALCPAYLDLVAFGTIADVMPLRGENRLIVSMGLYLLGKTTRTGLRALMEQSSVSRRLSAATVSFTLAPRVNAAGRLGSAMRAVELLLSESELEASAIAAELCERNRERQNEENGIFASAQARIDELGAGQDPILVLDHDDWHPGITGIAASRVTERYGRPSFLITYDGEVGKGSARSIPGVNLMALLGGCGDLLIQYGGHEMAAGLTVEREKVPLFRERICALAREAFPEGMPGPVSAADCEITLDDVTVEQIEQLSVLEPCGTDNPQPVFLLRAAELSAVTPVGGGRHARLQVRQGQTTLTAMYFGTVPDRLDYRVGDTVDLLVQMDLNEWNGRVTPQLLVRDMDHGAWEQEQRETAAETVCRFLQGEDGVLSPDLLPARPDFVRVYQYLRRAAAGEPVEMTLRALSEAVFDAPGGMWKCPLVLAVFARTGLLAIEEVEPGIADTGTHRGVRMRISVPEQSAQVDLGADAVYRRIEEERNSAARSEIRQSRAKFR